MPEHASEVHAGGAPGPFFEGGQTPLLMRLPKRGARNRFTYVYDNVILAELEAYIRMGKLDPRKVITMKHMYDAGLLDKKAHSRNGVALLAKRPSHRKRALLERKLGYSLPEQFEIPIEVEVRFHTRTDFRMDSKQG
jgi:ribosomal protein L15